MRTFWNSCWLGVLFANGEQNAINISKPDNASKCSTSENIVTLLCKSNAVT